MWPVQAGFFRDSLQPLHFVFFFFQAEDGIRDIGVTGVQDVCSSDLVLATVTDCVAVALPPAESITVSFSVCEALVSLVVSSAYEAVVPVTVALAVGAVKVTVGFEIGRASCRERG